VSDNEISFARPPVVEVIAGVAIDGLGAESAPLLTAFWHTALRDRFPKIEQQPPYFPPMEEFPVGAAGVGFQFNVGAPVARLWASTDDGQELIQLQPGWFACNWRKVKPQDEYDRWLSRRAAFERSFRALTSFLAAEGMGEPKITQCEVTYVNHIGAGALEHGHADFESLFSVALPPALPFKLEQVASQASFVLEENGQPTGRLHARVFPAFDRDGKTPLYVLELTVRGRPRGDGLSGALTFLDGGRAAINKAFVALTTAEMQARWGRVQ